MSEIPILKKKKTLMEMSDDELDVEFTNFISMLDEHHSLLLGMMFGKNIKWAVDKVTEDLCAKCHNNGECFPDE